MSGKFKGILVLMMAGILFWLVGPGKESQAGSSNQEKIIFETVSVEAWVVRLAEGDLTELLPDRNFVLLNDVNGEQILHRVKKGEGGRIESAMMLAVKNGAQAKLHKVENRLAEEKASRARDMVNREIELEFKVGAQIQNTQSVVIEYNFKRKVKAYDFESGSEAEDKVNTADLMEISGEVQFFRAGVRVVGVHKDRGGYQFLIMGVQM